MYNLTNILAAIMLVGLACSNPKSTRVQPSGDFLVLTGNLYTDSGSLPGQVTAYLGKGKGNMLELGGGAFKRTYNSQDLNSLTPNLSLAPDSGNVRLYVQSEGQPQFVGVSEDIPITTRGNHSVADIRMTPSNVYEGQVSFFQLGGLKVEGLDATVEYFNNTAQVDANGYFRLDGIPDGDHKVTVSAPGYETKQVSVRYLYGKKTSGPDKIVLVPVGTVGGVLELVPGSYDDPYKIFVSVFSGEQVPLIRYHDDKEALAAAPFRPKRESFYYDFGRPREFLYYQFANQDQSVISEVQRLETNFTSREVTPGLIIGDGSGFIRNLTVPVRVIAPIGARGIRYSDSIDDLQDDGKLPWRNISDRLDYTFGLVSPERPSIRRELFAQFQLSDGKLSRIYSDVVEFQPFPKVEGPLIHVPDFPTSLNLVREMVIDIPEEAYEMRVWEEITEGSGLRVGLAVLTPERRPELKELWLNADSVMPFRFVSEGNHTLYVQFRTRDKVLSPIYTNVFTIRPVENVGYGFIANGGNFFTPSRIVDIQLDPPPGATGILIDDDRVVFDQTIVDFVPAIRQIVNPNFLFEVEKDGLNSVFVAYFDADNKQMNFHERQIFVDPFMGNFIIQGGQRSTYSRDINIELVPPANAVSYQIYEGEPTSSINWVAIASNNVLFQLSEEEGLKNLYVRYKLANDVETAFSYHSIELKEEPAPDPDPDPYP